MTERKNRDQLRGAIFSGANTKPKAKIIEFFGQEVEVRQPSMGTILSFRNASEDDKKSAMIGMIIAYVFVPGTDEKLFEEADTDQLVDMPFGADFTRLQQTISELSDVKITSDEQVKNSDGTA